MPEVWGQVRNEASVETGVLTTHREIRKMLNATLQQFAVTAFVTGDDEAACRFAQLLTKREQDEIGRLVLEALGGGTDMPTEIVAMVEVETSHGPVVFAFSRRVGDRGKAVSAYDRRTGRRVALTAEQSSRIWLERTAPLGMGLPIDPSAAEPGDMMHIVADDAERWADVRTVKVTGVVRADGRQVLGDDDIETVEIVETEAVAVAA